MAGVMAIGLPVADMSTFIEEVVVSPEAPD
jgi:hypothetical protein